MSVLVTDTGFGKDTFSGNAVEIDVALDPNDYIGTLSDDDLVRVPFDSFADGRGTFIHSYFVDCIDVSTLPIGAEHH